jgi:glycosyltransferase involved in cell wall biosynthesis
VRLVGMVDARAIECYYRDASLYVQSSTMECLPLALLSAMAHGLPIVTTDVDGCKEAIVHGFTGLTVPPRRIKLLAEAIGELLRSPEKAWELGRQARQHFNERFSLQATVPPIINTLFPAANQARHEVERSSLDATR